MNLLMFNDYRPGVLKGDIFAAGIYHCGLSAFTDGDTVDLR